MPTTQDFKRPGWFTPIAKRLLDISVSLLGLILVAPLLLVIAVLLWLTMGRPLFFRQRRPGLHGKPFLLIKFRTMRQAFAPDGRALPDKERLTWAGKLVRNLSLDELPQLWSVLKGDLSLVGPRPLLMEYLERYNAEQRRRLEVKPGITGWAQVKGREARTWEEKLDLDVWYVDHQSLWLDLKILCLTILVVLRGKGEQQARIDGVEFLGSPPKENKEHKDNKESVAATPSVTVVGHLGNPSNPQ